MDFCVYHVLGIILLGLNLNIKETQAQWDTNRKTSEEGCKKYCHADCHQYFPGSEFGPCVTANVECSCGLPPAVRTIMIIIGIVAFLMIAACVIRICKRRQYNRSGFTASPIQPNVGIVNNFSPPVSPYYPIASAPSVPASQQLPFNPGYANYNANSNGIGSSEDPPSYSEVVRGDAGLDQSHKLGWNFEKKQ